MASAITLEHFRSMLKEYTKQEDSSDSDGFESIFYVINSELFSSSDLNIDFFLSCNDGDRTILHTAAKLDHSILIQAVLNKLSKSGAIALLTVKNHTPLHVASYEGHFQSVESIVNIVNGQELLNLLNHKDERGKRAINYAVIRNHLQVYELLDDKQENTRSETEGKKFFLEFD